jgi:putative membrane protein
MRKAIAIPKAEPSDLGVAGRGLLMGLAEVVPGVSGGTMAFISGIYGTLVSALAAFGPGSVAMLLRPREFWEHHNLRFLLVLAAGMGLGIVLFAQLMHFLLAHYQPLVWAFFSGVIAMSVVVIGRYRRPAQLFAWGPVGLLLGLSLMWLPTLQNEPAMGLVFFGGAVAVCAWLLPAVSGSYVLLALGLYAPVIDAVARLDITVLGSLAAGCAVGLLLFAKALSWLLHHYSEALLSLLTGFMLGSLPKLWPWQDAASDAVWARFLSAGEYHLLYDEPAYLVGVVLLFALGCCALWLLTRLDSDT